MSERKAPRLATDLLQEFGDPGGVEISRLQEFQHAASGGERAFPIEVEQAVAALGLGIAPGFTRVVAPAAEEVQSVLEDAVRARDDGMHLQVLAAMNSHATAAVDVGDHRRVIGPRQIAVACEAWSLIELLIERGNKARREIA